MISRTDPVISKKSPTPPNNMKHFLVFSLVLCSLIRTFALVFIEHAFFVAQLSTRTTTS